MSRTTSAAVQGVLRLGSEGGDYNDIHSPSLTPYIDLATAIVDRVETCAIAKGLTLTSTELELIERWLAAHYYVCSDQTRASKSTEGASASYHGQTGKGLESSRYGQAALDVDYSGCLAAISTRARATLDWLGLKPSEQTDASDRD